LENSSNKSQFDQSSLIDASKYVTKTQDDQSAKPTVGGFNRSDIQAPDYGGNSGREGNVNQNSNSDESNSSSSNVGKIILANIIVAVIAIVVLGSRGMNAEFFGYMLGYLAIQFLAAVVGSLVSAIILRLAVRFALGFKVRYSSAYGISLLAYTSGLVAGLAFGVFSVITEIELTQGGFIFTSLVLGIFVQALIYGLVLKRPSGSIIGFPSGLGVTFMQVIIAIAIGCVLFTGFLILSVFVR